MQYRPGYKPQAKGLESGSVQHAITGPVLQPVRRLMVAGFDGQGLAHQARMEQPGCFVARRQQRCGQLTGGAAAQPRRGPCHGQRTQQHSGGRR